MVYFQLLWLTGSGSPCNLIVPERGWVVSEVGYLNYKFRLYPTLDQERELLNQLETLRRVCNEAVGLYRELWKAEKRSYKRSELYTHFKDRRNAEIADRKAGGAGPHWLAKVPSIPLRDALDRVHSAFGEFRKGKRGQPRFKKRGQFRSLPFCGLTCWKLFKKVGEPKENTFAPTGGDLTESRSGHRLYLQDVGRVRLRVHRAVPGTIRTLTVLREPDGKWFAVFAVQAPVTPVVPKEGPVVGVDVGIARFLTKDNGAFVSNPRPLEVNLKKLRRLQRANSRKVEQAKKDGKKVWQCQNLKKGFKLVAALHSNIRRFRGDFHHQIARRLVRCAGTVVVESLNVQGMNKNRKLSRHLKDVAWGGFLLTLDCKAKRAGVGVIKVDPAYTSQTCSHCGVVDKLSRRSQSLFWCRSCGWRQHADKNAARNIRERGLQLLRENSPDKALCAGQPEQ